MNKIIATVSLLLACYGCGIYKFNGASISPDVKTISIQTFFNNAPLGPSNMSVSFTEAMKDYFQQNTRLALIDDEGDLQFDGYIENYTITPVGANAPGGAGGRDQINFSQLSRITITVYASFINAKDDTFDFEKRFSFFRDFDQEREDLSANEQAFVEEIFDQLIIDIFNASVANW